MSADVGEQIVVDLPRNPQPILASPPKKGPVQESEAGPSIHRRTRSSDVHINGPNGIPQAEPPKVEVEQKKYIQPDHFYPTSNHSNSATLLRNIPKLGEGLLSPEDDPQALRGIPVFKPTLEEFQDFEAYATATTEWGQYSGIVKIIPPEEWKSTLPPITKTALQKQAIRAPIQQNIFGTAGLFKIANVPRNKNRPLSVKEWFNKCNEKKFTGIGPKDVGKTLNRDSKEAIEWRARKNAEIKKEKEEKRRKIAERKAKREAAASVPDETQNNVDQETKENDPVTHDPSSTVPPLDPSSTSSHSSPEPTNPATPEAESDSEHVEPWYKSFNPSEDWLPKETKPEDYNAETCAAMERHLWKNMGIGEPSWYGADMEGSLFVDEKTPWNVAHLPNLLNRWDLKHLPGVNAPYLYFGMWGATFAWHVEDMDLFSINYIHFGAPKYWYAVPQLQAEKFERVLQGYFPEESRHCDQYLRHKAFAVSPHRLANDGVHVNMLVHNQGEFVITYPRGYHAGFNLGFNCAESVNFALDSWVELGRRAKACQCVTHSVHIDVDEMMAKEEKRMNGEQELLDAIAEERQNKKPRKRVHGDYPATSRKRMKREVEIADGDSDADQSLVEEEEINSVSKIPVMRKKIPKLIINLASTNSDPQPVIIKENPVYPCLFCPSLDKDGLLPVLDPTDTVRNIWKPRTEEIKIHHQCALAMPGVGIEDQETDGKLVTYVVGLDNIEQARWNLKCAACEDKRLAKSGAKIQCTKGKCPRAYHVSCAKNHDAASLKIWEVETPIMPAEGEEPLPEGAPIPTVRDIKVELLCPQHNPDMKAQMEAKKAEAFKRKVLSIPVGSNIKIKARGGASLEYTLAHTKEDTQEVVVQTDTGYSEVYPWSLIDFRPAAIKVENEYARVHTTTRKVSDHPTGTASPSTQPSIRLRIKPIQMPSTVAAPVIPPVRVQEVKEKPIQHPPPLTTTQFAPLRLDQMLNPRNEPPSRVILCEDPRTTSLPVRSHPPPQQFQRAQPLPHAVPPYQTGHQIPLPMQHPSFYQPAPSQYYQPKPVPQVVPYDSRDPFNRPLPPYERGYYQPLHHVAHAPVDTRRSSLTDQPPPFFGVPGYHAPPPHLYVALPPHTVPAMTHAGGSRQSNAPSHPPPTDGRTSSDRGAPGPSKRRKTSGSGSKGAGKINLGIKRMQSLMDHLPPLTVPAIHLAGTNGKGSVSAMLESCLMNAGMNVGRYNSPHLLEPRDAVRINGQPPSRQAYNDAIQSIERINQQLNLQATTFEIATAAAFQILNTVQPPLDIMIIECGMGGARDATNVIPDQIKLVCGLTSVGLDHTAFLGNSIMEIATEKAMIVSKGGILVVAPQDEEDAMYAGENMMRKKKATVVQAFKSQEVRRQNPPMSLKPFTKPSSRLIKTILPIVDTPNFMHAPPGARTGRVDFTNFQCELNLGGDHQLNNLSLAVTILDVLRNDQRSIDLQPKLIGLDNDDIIKTGIKRTEWAGRCSWLHYKDKLPLLVDGAHNSDSSSKLREYIDYVLKYPPSAYSDRPMSNRPKNRFIISLSSSPGKSIESVLGPLLYKEDEVIIMEFTNPVEGMPWIKPVPQKEIYDVVKNLVNPENIKFGGIGLEGLKSVLDNLIKEQEENDNAEEKLNVVCGSLYGVADVYRLFMV
ncbi:uncharacterized protein L201_002372 [Kwoniella dendrophila CBS 6074]|uniref:[histone H3]-trimethyl-L-lysine(9) demethylase n=1 Tax=Kwoniella dendrophila CBS 6074 TaxID=1295534 RepID=A0AAX4JQ38_9TREE